MIKKIIFIITLSVMLSGCFMAPMALIGPASSGFTSASLVQSGFTTTASYMVKKSTGKSFSEHAFDAITEDILLQTYLPKNKLSILDVKYNYQNEYPSF